MTIEISQFAEIFLLCIALSALVSWVVIKLCPSDFLAVQKSNRSNHSGKPRQLGGLSIYFTTLIGYIFFVFPLTEFEGSDLFILAALSIIFMVGLLDDLFGLSQIIRLIFQFCVAGLLVFVVGNSFINESSITQILFVFAIIVTVYWINAVNFMDGLDWLVVAGLTLPMLVQSIFLFKVDPTYYSISVLCLCSAGALLGFSFWNKAPALIFLGDSGSLFLGAVSACLMLATTNASNLLVAVTPFLYFFTDTIIAILFRLKRRENIFHAHSTHAYQLAFRSGMTHHRIAIEIFVLNVILSFLSLAVFYSQSFFAVLFFIAALLISLLFVLRYRLKKNSLT